MKKNFFIAIFIATITISLFSKNLEIDKKIYDKYVQPFGDLVTAQETAQEKVLKKFKWTSNEISKLKIEQDKKEFLLAKLEWFMARNYILFDDPQTMIKHYKDTKTGRFTILKKYYKNSELIIKYDESSLKRVNKLIEKKYESSNVLLLKSALYGDLCLVKNLKFLIIYGPKVDKITSKVLKTEPRNLTAIMNKAAVKIYSPKIWGGDHQKGIEILNKIITDSNFKNEPKQLQLAVYTGYAMSYGNLQEYEKAQKYCNLALKIFPNNIYALGVQELIKTKSF